MDHNFSIAVTANSLAVVDVLYRGIKFWREVAQDPEADELYVRLITEKARYAEWKRHTGIEKSEDIQNLMNKLPVDARQSLPSILLPMGEYVDLAEKLFKNYGITSPHTADKQRSFRDKLRRVDLLSHGQRQLDDLLKTLKDCNDGLLTIEPPAPEPGMTHLQNAPNFFRPIIEFLHSTCLEVLRAVVVRYPIHHVSFSRIADRLATWGTGLSQKPATIDQALNTDSRGATSLRNNISGTLSDIAVVLSKLVTLHTRISVKLDTLKVDGRPWYRVIDHPQWTDV